MQKPFFDILIELVKETIIEIAKKNVVPIPNAEKRVSVYFPGVELAVRQMINPDANSILISENSKEMLNAKIIANLVNFYKSKQIHSDIHLSPDDRVQLICVRVTREIYAIMNEKDFQKAHATRNQTVKIKLKKGGTYEI